MLRRYSNYCAISTAAVLKDVIKEQKMICNKIDGAPEQQDDNQPPCNSNIDDIDAVTEGVHRVDISDSNNDDTSEVPKEICAACGKEGKSCDMNTCNKCKSVKYCNAACKKKHRSKHKKACEKRVAELYDEKLFKEPPPREECPICMLPLPFDSSQVSFQTCCGKRVCHGCIYAMEMSKGNDSCAFCRTPFITSDEEQINIQRLKKLMDKGNGGAFHLLAGLYARGMLGMPQDHRKANELLLRAGELGFVKGYYGLGNSYYNGWGTEADKKKAKYYLELAAINGHIKARHNLGLLENWAGNHQCAIKHFMLAARSGFNESLDAIKQGFMDGMITKDEYAKTLRACHEKQQEMKSDTRDTAAKLVAKMRRS